MPDTRPTKVRYIVLLGLCLMAALAYLHRVALGVVESTARVELVVDEKAMGRISFVFFITYAFCQIPAGMLVDRWGGRRALLLFGMLGAVTMALGGLGGFMMLMISRGLMGIAQAGLFPASTSCLRVWFPIERRALAMGLLAASMSLGAAFGAFLTGEMLSTMNWRTIFMLFSIPGVVLCLWFYTWFRDHPTQHSGTNDAERELLQPISAGPLPKTRTPWGRLFTRPGLYWVSGQQFFRAMANVLYLTWFPTLLQKVYDVPKESAGMYTMYPLLGVVIGSLAGGIASDWVLARTGDRKFARRSVAIVTLFIGAGLFGVAQLQTNVNMLVVVVTIAAIFSSMSNPCAYSATLDVGGRYTGSVFSTMNMSGNIGAALFPAFVPYWVGWFSNDWSSAFWLVGGLYGAGMLCWLMIDTSRELIDEPPITSQAVPAATPVDRS